MRSWQFVYDNVPSFVIVFDIMIVTDRNGSYLSCVLTIVCILCMYQATIVMELSYLSRADDQRVIYELVLYIDSVHHRGYIVDPDDDQEKFLWGVPFLLYPTCSNVCLI